MKSTTAFLLTTLTVATAPLALADPLVVNCDQGDSLAGALAAAVQNDTVTVSGTCVGPVTIITDGLTLTSQGDATLDGDGGDALTIDGVQRVTVEGVTVRNGFNGIVVTGGASAALLESTVEGNVLSGIRVEANSSLKMTNATTKDNGLDGVNVDRASELTVVDRFDSKNNGVFGMFFNNASSGTFSNADARIEDNTLGVQIGTSSSVFVSGADSTVTASNNLATGLTVVSGSTLFVFEGRVVTRNNRFNHGVSANSNSNIDLDRGGEIDTRSNGLDGIQLEDSLLNMFNMPGFAASTVVAKNNGRHGLSAFQGSKIDLSGDSVVSSMNNGDAGVLVDNGSSVRIINSTITNNARDMALTFGSRADLTNNEIEDIECDSTVLIRGDTDVRCRTEKDRRHGHSGPGGHPED